jgi:hypothetical protein
VIKGVVLTLEFSRGLGIPRGERLRRVSYLLPGELGHQRQLPRGLLAVITVGIQTRKLLVDQFELVGDQRAALRELDQCQDQSQITSHGRLARGDLDQLRIDPPTNRAQTLRRLSDLPAPAIGWVSDRCGDQFKHMPNPHQLMLERSLDLGKLLCEARTHA